ncbi:hypothetical protein Tco_1104137 [Tanacetum coccineum]
MASVIFNSVHHNSHNEVDIDNMTLEEYARYELTMSSKRSELDNPTLGFTSQFFNQTQHTPNPPLDKEDSSLNEILDKLFRIGAENMRKMEYEVPNRCDDEIVDIIDYEDSDQEDGELPDLPTFSATNVFASICEQVKDDIDISIMKEKEDVQMDEDYDIDHSNTEEMLQWSFTNDPFLVCMELNDQANFMQQSTLTSISNNEKREFKIPHRYSLQGDGIQGLHDSFYVIYAFGISFLAVIQVEVCRVMLGRSLATGKHFKTVLVGYHVDYDDETICDNGCCSRKQT